MMKKYFFICVTIALCVSCAQKKSDFHELIEEVLDEDQGVQIEIKPLVKVK